MIKVGFINDEKRLSLREGLYWEKVFKENLVIGSEIELMFKDESIGTTRVRNLLKESCGVGSSPGYLNCPVEEVKSDGSLINGAEILTPGRRYHSFLQMFGQYKMIYDTLAPEEPKIDQRMGWHNHILLSNYNGVNVAEMPVPSIIFKNLMSLCKHFYPALTFISSTTPQKGVYTRYNSFCTDENLRNLNIEDTVQRMKNDFSDRYNAININNIKLADRSNDEGGIEKFHVEFRFPDGNIVPVHMASLNALYKALVIKAVKLSKFGLVSFPNFAEKIEPLYLFKNNGSMFSTSTRGQLLRLMTGKEYRMVFERQSEPLEDKYVEAIRELAVELVDFLETEIEDIDGVALNFLRIFAKKPVSVMFDDLDTEDPRVVEDHLEEVMDSFYVEEDSSLLPIIEVIENEKIEAESFDEWKEKVSEMVSYKGSIDEAITKLKSFFKITYVKGKGIKIS